MSADFQNRLQHLFGTFMKNPCKLMNITFARMELYQILLIHKQVNAQLHFIYQIRRRCRRTNPDFRSRKKRCSHHVQPKHRTENVPNIRLVVLQAHRLISLIACSYRPILHIVYIVSSILFLQNTKCISEEEEKEIQIIHK